MAGLLKIMLCLLLYTSTVISNENSNNNDNNNNNKEKEELIATETRTRPDGKLEIIKKIKKINEDGSYTIGYEADDGSFKIESRDVLGHIKGTYGFVDDDGTIKRVSYSSSNSTEPATTTAKSPLIFSTSFTSTRPPSTTTSNVVQSIAKKRTSATPQRANVKNEDQQIARPEVVTVKPTQVPVFKTLTLKRLEEDKPVHEEFNSHNNILRRQLQPASSNFNAREEVFRLQQSLGNDNGDVYTNSMSTSHVKPPLFTTTSRPRLIPTPQPVHYHHQPGVTPQPVPVVQIPPNRPEEQLVAVKHQHGTILVPLSHLQGRLVPIEDEQFQEQQQQGRVVEIEQQKAVVRKLPPPPLRPIPVQVDENGYIRELPRHVPTPYPLPIPVTPKNGYYQDHDIDDIQPPVSTRDFHRLLQQLILRQSRLEKISTLTRHHQQQPEVYVQMQQRVKPVYIQPEGYYQEQEYLPQRKPVIYHENQYYKPTRRVARLQPEDDGKDEYLPVNVREMLLLRMLQLAINPALPVDDADLDIRKKPVRNVEILGEEESIEMPKRRM